MLSIGLRRRILISMPTVTLKAHYDGSRILLDEPYDLPTDSPLMVTVLPPATSTETERAQWAQAAAAGLARAYGDDEPDYSPADVLP